MVFKMLRRAAVLAAAGTLLPAQAALAQAAPPAPSVVGTYVGAVSGTQFNCTLGGSPVPGTFPDSFVLTINVKSQSGSTFTADGSDSDGGVIDPFTATLGTDGSFETTVTYSEGGTTGSATVFGTFTASGLDLADIAGADQSGPAELCEFQYSGTLDLISGGAAGNPALKTPTEITSTTQLQSFARQYSQSLGRRFGAWRSGVAGGASPVAEGVMVQHGLGAGEHTRPPIGVWGSWAHTDSKDDSAASTFTLDRDSLLGGVDVSLTDSVLLGVALGYETSDVATPVNLGRQDIDGYTVAPYVAVLVTDSISVDFSAGISSIDITQSRQLGAATLRSSLDSERSFLSGNVTAYHSYGAMTVTGFAGLLYARDKQDPFTESDQTGTVTVANAGQVFKLGQVRVGFEGAYAFGEFEPYVALALEHDYSLTKVLGAPNDQNGGVLGGGVRYFGATNGITGSFDYQSVLGRDDLNEATFSFNLRVDF